MSTTCGKLYAAGSEEQANEPTRFCRGYQDTRRAWDEAKSAIAYTLSRIQENPDLRWIMLDTEAMARLMRAEAMMTGQPEESVREKRREDLQPAHHRRQADVTRMRKQIEDIQAVFDEINYTKVPGGSGHTMIPDSTLASLRAAIYPTGGGA